MNPFNDDDASDTGETQQQQQIPSTPNQLPFASPMCRPFISGAPGQPRQQRRPNLASVATTPVVGGIDAALNCSTTPIALMQRVAPSSPFLSKRGSHSPISNGTWKRINVKTTRPRYDDTPITISGAQNGSTKPQDCLLDLNDLETIPLHTTHLFRVPPVGFECNNEVTFSFTNNKSEKKKKVGEVKEIAPHFSFATEVKPTQGSNEKLGCNCRNSKCLKLYCECLRRGDFCDPSCNCHECENHHYSKVRETKIREIEKKNPLAFKPLVSAKEITDVKAHHKGCNCKKSNCLKNYCECHQFGVMCTPACKCVSCKNTAEGIAERGSAVKNAPSKLGVKADMKAARVA